MMTPRFILLSILAAAFSGLLILTGHGPHVVGYLPYFVLFACPVMHVFMHHGHHRQEKDRRGHSEAGQAPN